MEGGKEGGSIIGKVNYTLSRNSSEIIVLVVVMFIEILQIDSWVVIESHHILMEKHPEDP